MGALVEQFAVAGIRLAVRPGNKLAAQGQLTDEQREAIRANRGAILAELEQESQDDPATAARRKRVLAILALHPDWRYAVITDDHSDLETTTLHIGIRSVGTGEVVIAKARYHGAELIRLMDDAHVP